MLFISIRKNTGSYVQPKVVELKGEGLFGPKIDTPSFKGRTHARSNTEKIREIYSRSGYTVNITNNSPKSYVIQQLYQLNNAQDPQIRTHRYQQSYGPKQLLGTSNFDGFQRKFKDPLYS